MVQVSTCFDIYIILQLYFNKYCRFCAPETPPRGAYAYCALPSCTKKSASFKQLSCCGAVIASHHRIGPVVTKIIGNWLSGGFYFAAPFSTEGCSYILVKDVGKCGAKICHPAQLFAACDAMRAAGME